MKKKLNFSPRNVRKKVASYIITNRLFISYFILSLIGTILLRYNTVGKALSIKPIICDIALILIIGSFGYFVKPKKQFRYYFICMLVYTVAEVLNSIYYTFFVSFASFGEISSLSQTDTVTGSIIERLKLTDFSYIFLILLFILIHHILKTSPYYSYMSKVEKGKKMFLSTFIVGLVFLGITFITASKSDYSRLNKQWNRIYIVERFGIIMYQGNDLFQTLTPKFSSLFGYEDSAKLFKEFYSSNESKEYEETNKYTNILEGKNVIFVHMEGIQTYLMNLNFNGVEATPTINKLSKEGLFFDHFYPQISTGTSSDTEFTLLTSLLPASSGVVFTTYYDREYVTIPKLLKEKGYYTFSMHGNLASMWNRNKVHPNLGYEGMYFKESFDFTEDDVINLGINDKLFFKQAIPILEKIEQDNKNYMGTIITLSNHSPFIFLDKYGEYDMSVTYKDEAGNDVTTNYLANTPVGNYITSAHYADVALGEFIDYINASPYFNDTVFVMYGDHDAKLSRKELNYLYNYDYKTGEVYEEDDPEYTNYDYFDHELNKNTPLIIWTKNKSIRNKLHGTNSNVMGMYDIMPTIGNMMGFKNDFALGHDIFNIKDKNLVVYPNGNYVTNYVYYNNSKNEYKIISDKAVLNENYVEKNASYAEKRLEVSNALIVHDLIKNEKDNLEKMIENRNSEEN
ncbi:MAG: LTA synthase family protein [Bacilli bacterium]|nr:LTA synthase family protein [Bacilli bacterium]